MTTDQPELNAKAQNNYSETGSRMINGWRRA